MLIVNAGAVGTKMCKHDCRSGDECPQCDGIWTWMIAMGILIVGSGLVLMHAWLWPAN